MPFTQVPVAFEDIAIYFSQEEWKDLEKWQKELYKDVMKENYQILISIGAGSPAVTPDIISHIEQVEEPYVGDELGSEESKAEKNSCSGEFNNKRDCCKTTELKSGMNSWEL
ncbi:protein ZNF783-like [Microcaecilia unicolor]|uniref:Protein ZNF783-like n=1 Tax=Microcaecilia unicolor TaxID=1415580 RepID=A0A6P7XL39_9AMPH|nr:protein ZNF783-like [Microcaecilia unicolor]